MNTNSLGHMLPYPTIKRTRGSKIPTLSSKAINEEQKSLKKLTDTIIWSTYHLIQACQKIQIARYPHLHK